MNSLLLHKTPSILISRPIKNSFSYCTVTQKVPKITVENAQTPIKPWEVITNNKHKLPHSFWKDSKNQEEYLTWLSNKLNIQKLEDWYQISNEDIIKTGGRGLLNLYDGSSSKLISETYSDYAWQTWRFNKVPAHFWTDINNQRKYMKWLSQQLNIQSQEDWYKVTKEDILKNGGRGILYQYKDSPSKAIMSVFDDLTWLPWKFGRVSHQFWKDKENQKNYMNWISSQLNIQKPQDWFDVTAEKLIERDGFSLLSLYGFSMRKLLVTVYPDIEQEIPPWRFHDLPPKFWNNKENHKKFINYLAKELNIKTQEDWYHVTNEVIIKYGGRGLLPLYKNTACNVIMSLVPESEWLIWKFAKVPSNFWEDVQNQKLFLEHLAKHLKIEKPEDWYNVGYESIIKYGGGGLLSRYGDSPSKMLIDLFPSYKWQLWRFQNVPKGFIEKMKRDRRLQRDFLDFFRKSEYIQQDRDLLNVSKAQLEKYVYNISVADFTDIVQHNYPLLFTSESRGGYDTNNPRKRSLKMGLVKKSQIMLRNYIRYLFPDQEILEDFNHPEIIHKTTGEPLQLDIWLPQYKLALEYQGIQHYRTVNIFKHTLQYRQHLDKLKKEICNDLGITLIPIPFWWNLEMSSLQATLYKIRPDLFSSKPEGEPIPIEQPSTATVYKNKSQTAKEQIYSKIMYASNWAESTDPTGWWLSEKYDGVRCFWDGKSLQSGRGNKIKAPAWFTDPLPDIPLDGELWIGHGSFHEASALTSSAKDKYWKEAVYMVFDLVMTHQPFEQRYKYLKQFSFPPFVQIVQHTQCIDKNHFHEFYSQVKQKNGEGIMLKKAESLYQPGRSLNLRKYKGYHDTEVRLITVEDNGLLCEQLNGKEVTVICVESILQNPPPIGSILTVKYDTINHLGKLSLNHYAPSYMRVRTDVEWEDLKKQHQKEEQQSEQLSH